MTALSWQRAIVLIVLLGIFSISSLLFFLTGFLRPDAIDKSDTTAWTRGDDGIIKGHDSFSLSGTSERCWLLIHSFAATPDEMRSLATRLHHNFNDTVVAPRLYGHATLPSDLQRYTLHDWYTQVSAEYQTLASTCGEVHVVGSSIGGALALRLAEDYEVTAVYAINPYLYHTPQYWYYLASPEWYMETLEPYLHYIRRHEVAQIADPAGLATHVAYYNLPVRPMTASRDFFTTTEARLADITEPVVVLHSTQDPVSDYKTATTIYSSVNASEKSLKTFTRSEHILLRDYDQALVIDEIIAFINY